MLTLVLFKFKRLGVSNFHDVKNQSINEQKFAVFVNSGGPYDKKTLQNWVAGLEVLHSFLSKGSTWYVHLRFFAWCVNSILYLHKNNRNVIPQSMNIWLFLMHWVIYLYQNCIDSAVLILSNVMWNIRNEVDKTFVQTK